MTIDQMQLELGSYVDNFNKAKECVLERLQKDGVITKEKAEEYSNKWQFIIFKNSWYKKWLSIFGKEDKENDWSFKLVRFEE